MLTAMRPSEFSLWGAMYEIDPWGEERADLRAAMHTMITANVNRDSKKRSKPFTVQDFMPYAERKPVQPVKVDVLQTMRGWFRRRLKKGK